MNDEPKSLSIESAAKKTLSLSRERHPAPGDNEDAYYRN
jgi:hypothetical protein